MRRARYADPGNAATHLVVGGERGGGGGGGGGAAVTHAVLSNLAATSRSLCAAFAAAFDDRYAPLIALTRGNGEDLAFNDFARRAGGAAVRIALPAAVPLGAVAAGVATLDDGRTSGAAFYAKAGHYKLRVRIAAASARATAAPRSQTASRRRRPTPSATSARSAGSIEYPFRR